MKLIEHHNPFPFLEIKNFYSEIEMEKVWQELFFLTDESKLKNPTDSGSATDQYGNLLKENKSIFLEDVYKEKKYSNIENINSFIVENREIKKIFSTIHPFYRGILNTQKMNNLISYYENDDYYFPHVDNSYITLLIWLYQEPKSFNGGDMIFPEYDFNYPIENNCGIMFPGCVEHGVTKIVTNYGFKKNKCLGRYCITSFFMH